VEASKYRKQGLPSSTIPLARGGHGIIFCQGYNSSFDELVKSRFIPFSVIPAEAGIQSFQAVLDPGVRRGDDKKDFLRLHQALTPLIVQMVKRRVPA
jgi:hypothetical protein